MVALRSSHVKKLQWGRELEEGGQRPGNQWHTQEPIFDGDVNLDSTGWDSREWAERGRLRLSYGSLSKSLIFCIRSAIDCERLRINFGGKWSGGFITELKLLLRGSPERPLCLDKWRFLHWVPLVLLPFLFSIGGKNVDVGFGSGILPGLNDFVSWHSYS